MDIQMHSWLYQELDLPPSPPPPWSELQDPCNLAGVLADPLHQLHEPSSLLHDSWHFSEIVAGRMRQLNESTLGLLDISSAEVYDSLPSSEIPASGTNMQKGNEPTLDIINFGRSQYNAVLRLSDIASVLPKFSTVRTKEEQQETAVNSLPISEAFLENPVDVPVNDFGPLPLSRKPNTKKTSCSTQHRMKIIKTTQTKRTVGKKGKLLPEPQQKPIDKSRLSARDIHIYSERQRRRDMSQLFSTLRSLLPQIKLKTDRCTVLAEVTTYIHSLREKLGCLAKEKAAILESLKALRKNDDNCATDKVKMLRENVKPKRNHELYGTSKTTQTDEKCGYSSIRADVSVRLCGDDAFITLNCPKRKGVWSGVLLFLQNHNLDVVNSTLAATAEGNFHCIHAKVSYSVDAAMDGFHTILQQRIREEVILQLCKP